jgi:uncharacterized protein
VTVRSPDEFPRTDAEVPAFVADLGLSGIVDIHVHALPDRLQRAVWDYFDRLDDPPWPIRYRLPADDRLAALRRAGVIAHTALAYAHKPGMIAGLNDYTLDLADRHDAVLPTFTIYPEDGVAEMTATAIARGGAVVKVHLQVGRFHATDPRLDAAWELIAAHRLPVVLHATAVYGVDGGAEYCGIDAVRALLDRHPHLVIVLAHLGMPDYDDALDLAVAADRVYLDTAMTLHHGDLSPATPAAYLDRLAEHADRIVFGSDYPTIPHDYAVQVRGLANLRLDDALLRRVLHDTARELLDTRR